MNNRNHEKRNILGQPAPVGIEPGPHCPAPKPSSTLRQAPPAHPIEPSLAVHLRAWMQRIRSFVSRMIKRRGHQRKLHLLEIQQLGEKRFVAIVRVGKQKFLIGGAASSVSLLAEVGAQRTKVLAPRPFNEERA
jgi:hypothetical protein